MIAGSVITGGGLAMAMRSAVTVGTAIAAGYYSTAKDATERE